MSLKTLLVINAYMTAYTTNKYLTTLLGMQLIFHAEIKVKPYY